MSKGLNADSSDWACLPGFSWPAGQDQKNKEVDLARFTGQVFSKCKCKLWERRNARSACIHTPEKNIPKDVGDTRSGVQSERCRGDV